ncbi:serine hydrolase domain-containing protein [Alterisphingorhabdus coralli]|uniref:Serine hydrolase n=1 Tax=Alterisphingorhabdus coralli TaxID=3071408 RepID=A0AA97I125_9SPHN|nr:serine hydrolase [Parasphingorhabdus sp. SCSIO 66989]WOE75617.1 serine hydrolase [Parasphingorhabdus sp. SCSIO 66989]
MSSPEADFTAFNLCTGAVQHHNFARPQRKLRSVEVAAAAQPSVLEKGETVSLPESYMALDGMRETFDLLARTDTASLLILKQGKLVFEQYSHNAGPDTQWVCWSISKSLTSALIGIAVAEGAIESVDDPVTRYVPELQGTAYDGPSVKKVLQMSSGVACNEDYSIRGGDFEQLLAATGPGKSIAAHLASLKREYDPGTVCRYSSVDTEVLGMVLRGATGQSLASFMEEKLAGPLGFEAPAYWHVDETGQELASAGAYVCPRDLARFGELYRNSGCVNGQQIIPESWVRASITPDAPHLMPGEIIVSGEKIASAYGYQWWLSPSEEGYDFAAVGIFGQFIYICPSLDITIVKQSATRTFGTAPGDAQDHMMETSLFLAQLARAV